MRLKDKVTKRKGRGFGTGATRAADKIRGYESVDNAETDAPGPQKCIKLVYAKLFFSN